MQVDLIVRADDVEKEKVAGRPAAVIDVLRATTTITTALEAGCRAIVPALEPEEARHRATAWSATDGRQPLLGGERKTRPIPGFDLGNSPSSYTKERVGGRVIFFTTTNGTRALRACQMARTTVCACLRNARAAAHYLAANMGAQPILVCSGREGTVAPEDVAVAGLIASYLRRLTQAALSPQAEEAAALASSIDDWYRFFSATPAGTALQEAGYDADIRFCALKNVSSLVPRYLKGMVLRSRCTKASGLQAPAPS